MSCDPCLYEIRALVEENVRLKRLISAMTEQVREPLLLALDRDGRLWCAEVVGVQGSFCYGGNLVEATRRAKAAALRAMGAAVERGEPTEADRLFSARGELH